MSSAFASLQTIAIVGFVWLRSICESIDFETPDWRAKASNDNPRCCLSSESAAPTLGGSDTIVEGAFGDPFAVPLAEGRRVLLAFNFAV